MSQDVLVWWGTNPVGGPYYADRVHVVWSSQPRTALCDMPVDSVWEHRPARPVRLCPECCLVAMSGLFPAIAQQCSRSF
jgi:hypothetical protein